MCVPQDGDPWPSPFDLMAPVNGAIFFIYLPGRDWRRSHSPEGAVACTISSRSVVRCQARPVPTHGSRGQANRVELRVNSPGFWHQALYQVFGSRSLDGVYLRHRPVLRFHCVFDFDQIPTPPESAIGLRRICDRNRHGRMSFKVGSKLGRKRHVPNGQFADVPCCRRWARGYGRAVVFGNARGEWLCLARLRRKIAKRAEQCRSFVR